jgi:hypothetical protein
VAQRRSEDRCLDRPVQQLTRACVSRPAAKTLGIVVASYSALMQNGQWATQCRNHDVIRYSPNLLFLDGGLLLPCCLSKISRSKRRYLLRR